MLINYFEKLVAWQKENPTNRTLSVEISPYLPNIKIWAYDISLAEGEFITEPDMPNLEAKADKTARSEYERLKARFDKEGGAI